MYLLTGEPDKAIAELYSVIVGDYEPKDRYMAHRALAGSVLPYLGRYDEALALVEIGLDSLRARADTSLILKGTLDKAGMYYWGWRDNKRMWEIVESTYAYPDEVKNQDYWLNLAALHFIDGDADEGRRLLDGQDVREIVLPIFYSLEYAGRGDCDAAQAQLDTAGVLTEQNKASVRFYTALCYLDQEDYQKAIDQLEIVVDERNFSFENADAVPKAHYRLARSYEALGEVAIAIEHYEKFLDIWKGADKDQTDLIDATARLAALQTASSM